ncbi:MAG: hypothetical protein O3A37_09480, partial [Planctomycetota bacterium]|nr:hypothetical protein [Planctomycetota bacterium]
MVRFPYIWNSPQNRPAEVDFSVWVTISTFPVPKAYLDNWFRFSVDAARGCCHGKIVGFHVDRVGRVLARGR